MTKISQIKIAIHDKYHVLTNSFSLHLLKIYDMEEIKQIIIDKATNLDEDGPFCIEFDYNEFAVIAKGSIYREWDKWEKLSRREVLFSEIYVTNDEMEKYFLNQEISDLQNELKV